MTVKIAAGTEVYNIDSTPVVARGISYTASELDHALSRRLPPIIWDEPGKRDAEAALAKAATTAFDTQRVRQILDQPLALEDWRVGEGIAEAYLVDHRECEFPWPHGRDVRNPSASPAGADLVGFHHGANEGVRLAFGEVKTSAHKASPPQVVKGRSGLAKQIEHLRDSSSAKDHLVRYLAYRADGARWQPSFQTSAARYLRDPSDVSLFGVLVRDVAPNAKDLGTRPAALAQRCPGRTSIELRVKYLPANAISTLATAVKKVAS